MNAKKRFAILLVVVMFLAGAVVSSTRAAPHGECDICEEDTKWDSVYDPDTDTEYLVCSVCGTVMQTTPNAHHSVDSPTPTATVQTDDPTDPPDPADPTDSTGGTTDPADPTDSTGGTTDPADPTDPSGGTTDPTGGTTDPPERTDPPAPTDLPEETTKPTDGGLS